MGEVMTYYEGAIPRTRRDHYLAAWRDMNVCPKLKRLGLYVMSCGVFVRVYHHGKGNLPGKGMYTKIRRAELEARGYD